MENFSMTFTGPIVYVINQTFLWLMHLSLVGILVARCLQKNEWSLFELHKEGFDMVFTF